MGTIADDVRQEVGQLGYFRDLRERRAWLARMTVLIAVVLLLVLNMYVLFLSTESVILNVDLARVEQSNSSDRSEERFEALELQVMELRASLAAAEPAAVAASERR